jgi:hypothetical protein
VTTVVGDTAALQASLTVTWLELAAGHVTASPEAHVGEMVRQALKAGVLRPVDGKVSDGFHTFDELYRHRMLLNAGLFRLMKVWPGMGYDPHKSLLHSDGSVPFGGEFFIVVAQLPTGQISYHYPLEHWDLFDIPERPKAAPWDGHTSEQAANRLQEWLESR